jgi:PTH1 family peptidyl-tRNA hydrolase
MVKDEQEGTLVVGLGNPGPSYAENRHNCGFMVLDRLAPRVGVFGWQEKFSGLFGRGRQENQVVTLLKPMTFMNRSGRSVARAANFYHYEINNILVVHDDLDLPFGTMRIKKGGGTGGHKGLASITQELGGNGYLRLRVGIGRPQHGTASDFVLKNFSTPESISLVEVFQQNVEAIECMVDRGAEIAMNKFNKRGGETNGC